MEFKLWFTRRYVKLLWQALQRMLNDSQQATIADSHTRQAIMSLEHEEVLSRVDFQSKYIEEPGIRRPLGEQPVLVSKIQIKPGVNNTQVLCLHPDQGQGLELVFDSTLLHSFCRLLEEGVQKADWGLEFRIFENIIPVSRTAH